MDWDDHRYFLAIARARSLTAAGKALGVSQPTVSRRLNAMEARLRLRLFERTKGGYRLTPPGAAILERLQRVERELDAIERSLFGQDREAKGPLTLSCTEIMLTGYLGPCVEAFLRRHPAIELRLHCSDAHVSLSRREADLALRFTARPPETLIGRRLTQVAFALYGTEGNDTAGNGTAEATGGATIAQTAWIGFNDEAMNRLLITDALGKRAAPAHIKHRTDSVGAMRDMTAAGLGLSVLPCYFADSDQRLRRRGEAFFCARIPDLWLLAHPDVKRVRRLRLLSNHVGDSIENDRDLFEGRRPQN